MQHEYFVPLTIPSTCNYQNVKLILAGSILQYIKICSRTLPRGMSLPSCMDKGPSCSACLQLADGISARVYDNVTISYHVTYYHLMKYLYDDNKMMTGVHH